jgi:hypothetical protein
MILEPSSSSIITTAPDKKAMISGRYFMIKVRKF